MQSKRCAALHEPGFTKEPHCTHVAVYQGGLHDWFLGAWRKATDKKLDMGKACTRFKKPEDVPLKLIGEFSGKVTPKQWIDVYDKTMKH